jgi:hypothetical protein
VSLANSDAVRGLDSCGIRGQLHNLYTRSSPNILDLHCILGISFVADLEANYIQSSAPVSPCLCCSSWTFVPLRFVKLGHAGGGAEFLLSEVVQPSYNL